MRSVICAALVLAACPSFADSIAHQGSNWVRLTLKPCEGKAAEAVQKLGGDPEKMRAAASNIGGQDFAACWMPAGGGAAVVYEDGDAGYVPMEDLKAVPEA